MTSRDWFGSGEDLSWRITAMKWLNSDLLWLFVWAIIVGLLGYFMFKM